MGFSIVTFDGRRRFSFDVLAQSGGLTYRSTWPGGDADASFAVGFGVDDNPPGLAVGSLCTVYDGPTAVYRGTLGVPQRGSPWAASAQGLSSLAERYLPLDSSGQLTLDADVAVDEAITRGLPWRRLQSLPNPSNGVPDTPKTLAALLDLVATASKLRWSVNARATVSMLADPASPHLMLVASDTPGGRSIDEYGTDVYALHTSPVVVPRDGGGVVTVATRPQLEAASDNPALDAARPWGRWERLYDTTPAGLVSSGGAADMADGALALISPEASFSGDLTVKPGDLRTLGGQPVRLAQIRAGGRVRIVGVQPDPALGQLVFTTSVDVTIGTWTYDAVEDVATLTPLGAAPRDLGTLLAAAARVK